MIQGSEQLVTFDSCDSIATRLFKNTY